MPVRDALKLLESEGLVRIYPYRGIEVSTLNPDDIDDLFGLREVLEQTAIARAIDRLTPAQLDEMEALLRQMDGLGDDDDRWLDLNTRFHAVLNGASGWPRLVEMIGVMRANVDRYVRAYVVQSGRSRPQTQHWALYEACRARDADAARGVIAEHLRDTAAALLRTLPRDDTAPDTAPDTERPAS
jgi:DNA-binding GntR family transcriptional regulator